MVQEFRFHSPGGFFLPADGTDDPCSSMLLLITWPKNWPGKIKCVHLHLVECRDAPKIFRRRASPSNTLKVGTNAAEENK